MVWPVRARHGSSVHRSSTSRALRLARAHERGNRHRGECHRLVMRDDHVAASRARRPSARSARDLLSGRLANADQCGRTRGNRRATASSDRRARDPVGFMRYANESSVVSSLGESASHAPARAPTKITGRETVYIVIVNWNGWRDTIECLESVLRNRYESYRVIVCDNGSSNDSVDRIREWAEGRLDLPSDSTHPLASLTRPGVPKPVPYTFLSRAEAEQGPLPNEVPPLVLIDCAANLGFAGGSNVGL